MSETPDDVVAKAKAALEGVEGPWVVDPLSYVGADGEPYWDVDGPCGGYVAQCQDLATADFIAAARSLVPELVAELEQAREDIATMSRLLRNPQTVLELDRAERSMADAKTLHIGDQDFRDKVERQFSEIYGATPPTGNQTQCNKTIHGVGRA